MRKNYWVKVRFADSHGNKIHIMLAIYCKEVELSTEVRIRIERIIEQNPIFRNCFYEGYEAEVKE